MQKVDAQGGPLKAKQNSIPYTNPNPMLVKETERMLLFSYLLGIDHVNTKIELADDDFNAIPFDEAVNFLKSRVPLTKDEWLDIEEKLRFRAFTVAALSDVDAIERVKNLTTQAIERGLPLSDFWTSATVEAASGLGDSPWYWETVYRTNIQTSYNAGRAAQFTKAQPEYLEFIGIEDSRQTDICNERSGTILPATHPFWQKNWPPLHFNCRSTVRAVFQEEVDALKEENPDWDISSENDLPQADLTNGFGGNPIETESFYKLTPKMLERAEKYGILDKIEKFKETLNLKSPKKTKLKLAKKPVKPAIEVSSTPNKTPQFKTIREAERYVIEAKLADKCSFKGCDIKVVQEWVDNLQIDLNRFPQAKSNMEFFGTIQERNKLVRVQEEMRATQKYIQLGYDENTAKAQAKRYATRWLKLNGFVPKNGTIAQCSRYQGSKGISFNSKYGKSYESLKSVIETQVKLGHFPEGTNLIGAIERHEMGHLLDNVSGFYESTALKSYYSSLSKEQIKAGLSGYATTSIKEFIAESWAEYTINPKPRAISVKVSEMLISFLGGKL